mmetsp:Transcript_16931/g.56833  ORF Transcript_16931/g.56833 Transcript_16931/m.56833 type:complete len:212 (-) Transcript_16931:62-697(-)
MAWEKPAATSTTRTLARARTRLGAATACRSPWPSAPSASSPQLKHAPHAVAARPKPSPAATATTSTAPAAEAGRASSMSSSWRSCGPAAAFIPGLAGGDPAGESPPFGAACAAPRPVVEGRPMSPLIARLPSPSTRTQCVALAERRRWRLRLRRRVSTKWRARAGRMFAHSGVGIPAERHVESTAWTADFWKVLLTCVADASGLDARKPRA